MVQSTPTRRHVMSRFAAATAVATLAAPTLGLARTANGRDMADTAEWQVFVERFVTPEGRVVDTGKAGISHTEGQGIGMLATAMFGDETTFARLLGWTEDHLRHRNDALHAWQYLPNGAIKVADQNPATDGELLIAHALLTAATRWGRPAYDRAAMAIVGDIAAQLVGDCGDRRVLLPGIRGAEMQGQVIVNPSYYLFPVLQTIAARTGDGAWMRLHDDGIAMLRTARFGRWGLPADWISLPRGEGRCMIAPGRPARFSYDAIRLPFYMAWAGLGGEPALHAAVSFWADGSGSAAWVDLRSDGVAPYAMTSGMRAIRDYVRARVGLAPTMVIPSIRIAPSYYDAALTLMVRIALATPGEQMAAATS